MNSTPMQSAGAVSPFPNFKSRFLAYPQTPEEATVTCPVCGVTAPPKVVEMYGVRRYIREQCACEQDARAARDRDAQLATQRATYAANCYTWLGPRWRDTALAAKSFATFDRARQPDAYDAARLFVGDCKGSLILHGSYGTGKTHILAAVCNAVMAERNLSALFTTASKLFAAIQARINAKDEDYGVLVSRAIRAGLFVIDDIDKANPSAFRNEIFLEILDARVNDRRPTAISTNRLDELEKFVGGAFCSRLKIGQIDAAMNGADFRDGLWA